MPGIRSRHRRLVENGYGVHVDDEYANEKRHSPAHDVPQGALGTRVLPQEQEPGDECEPERNRVVPERKQIVHLRISGGPIELMARAPTQGTGQIDPNLCAKRYLSL